MPHHTEHRMVKKKRIRDHNRVDKLNEIDQLVTVKKILECFNIGHMYYKKCCLDHAIISLNEKRLLSKITFTKETVPMDETKRYLISIYGFIDDVMDKISAFALAHRLDVIYRPNISSEEPVLNIFYLYQHKFRDIDELNRLVTMFNIDRYDAVRYVVVKFGRILFAYDLSYLQNNLHTIKNIAEVCYKECSTCHQYNDTSNKILQCTRCGLVACYNCHKRCPICKNQ